MNGTQATFTLEERQNLRTSIVHVLSEVEIETDAPKDNMGEGSRFSPTDLLAASLASCMVTTVAIKSAKAGINVGMARVNGLKIMSSDPRRVSRIELETTYIKDELYTAEEEDFIRKTSETCPVALSLSPNVEIVLTLTFSKEA